MKKILALLLFVVLILLTAGCGTTIPDKIPDNTEATEGVETDVSDNTETPDSNETDTLDNSSASDDNEKTVVENIIVSISEGEHGYYVLMADATLGYYEGEVVEVAIADPALLSFQVSESFDYGIYLFSLTEGDEMLESLATVMQELQSSGQYELAARIQLILDAFATAGPIISAST